MPAVVAVTGDQRFLKVACLRELSRRVLGEDDEFGPTRFAGETAELKAVLDELSTVSMWGGKRLALVEDADAFVSNHRAALERYVAKPAKGGVLVLDVKTWPKTTRLAKAVAEAGLELDCAELKGAELTRWVVETARDEYGKTLDRDASSLLAELAGPDLGLLDREIAKLADYAGDRKEVTAADVAKLVGGWKAETTFKMLEHVRAGDLGAALVELDRLLRSGEAPQRILGGVLFVYRKLAAATEAARKGTPLPQAVRGAGVFPKDQAESVEYLKRIGSKAAARFFEHLLEADGALRGQGRLPERVVLERLLVRLAGGPG